MSDIPKSWRCSVRWSRVFVIGVALVAYSPSNLTLRAQTAASKMPLTHETM